MASFDPLNYKVFQWENEVLENVLFNSLPNEVYVNLQRQYSVSIQSKINF